MKNRFVIAALMGIVLLVTACASGASRYAQISQSFPELKPGEGRIFFYRARTVRGLSAPPPIVLNGEVVGLSRRGAFFYVDRPAGKYVTTVRFGLEYETGFTLDAGETKYIHTVPLYGAVIGSLRLEVAEPDKAQKEIRKLILRDEAALATQ
ncbi:MAG: DUF2846 domain-containing protein [Azoarcus sp.]|nr:DUF2846 domain-containing protein [Azoarcus sp.]